MDSKSSVIIDRDDVHKEIEVMKRELEYLLKMEVPNVFKNVANHIQLIISYLTGDEANKKDRINLTSTSNLEGLKCSLIINSNELKNIEINFKPTPRHNNYMYKSREDTSWILYQITNCCDIIKALQTNIENFNFKTLDQTIFNIDRMLDSVNSARNILLFPKKRNITELQSQKNMKIFPLVPNDLVFSFYIQGHKLLLSIYIIKGNESTKHILECTTIAWLNNVLFLLTNCLQILQHLKDKLVLFEQIDYE